MLLNFTRKIHIYLYILYVHICVTLFPYFNREIIFLLNQFLLDKKKLQPM